ncbi:uncharacterized protein [Leptinotarsa decemlineata]|uniref:uncharacterized protein n=1 Tax=Leptinotarsa decemlineata TaxID=7539 RepID=UPI003D30BEC7
MEWDNEKALQLIDEYEKYPILWNAKHPEHFSRNKKSDAWEHIAYNLKVEEHEAKQKMNSLLGSFRREKAKGKKSFGTGIGQKDVYISKWYAFKRMHYLLDKDEPRETIDTETECAIIDEVQNPEEADRGPQDTSPQNSDLGSKTPQIDLQPQDEQDVNEMPPKPKKRKAKSNNEDPRLEEAFQILTKMAAPQAVVTEDELAVYGKYIAHKLRGYSRRTRVEVEHAFSRILYEADIGKYEWVAPPVPFVPHTMSQQLTTPLPTLTLTRNRWFHLCFACVYAAIFIN